MGFAPWTAATHCTGSATPGAQAVMKWALAALPHTHNMGIYNCRNVRGGGSMSCHAEGRAADVGCNHDDGYKLVELLRPHADRMGIQCLIFNRTIWSAKSPGRAGRRYTGADPHLDHVHVELTRGGGRSLNVATIKHVLGGGAVPVSTVITAGSRAVKEGSRGHDVKVLQQIIGGVTADGVFGPKTTARLRWWQEHHGLKIDGAAGRHTWAALLRAAK